MAANTDQIHIATDAEKLAMTVLESESPSTVTDDGLIKICRELLEIHGLLSIEQARCVRAEQALRDLLEAERGLIASLLAVEPHLQTPYPEDARWTPWTRFVERDLEDVDEAHAAARSVLGEGNNVSK